MGKPRLPPYICTDYPHLEVIRTAPTLTRDGKPFDWMVKEKVQRGKWRLECIKAEVLGLERPLEVYRAARRTGIIKPWTNTSNEETYCPGYWADIAIGQGACGLRCRACFLMLTHRAKCDPSRHVLYENVEDYVPEVKKFLSKPLRKNLGLGIDCSDSLLYEGVTGHCRRLIPLFANPDTNPFSCKLILLTKTANVHYLQGLPTRNIILSFSLNPEPIADVWEGKWSDGLRVTPSIAKRLAASMRGQDMGFEVRWRVDPILPVNIWRTYYREFFFMAASKGHMPRRITLGTYRQMGTALATFAEKWGLPAMEWQLPILEKDQSHYHLGQRERIEIYRSIKGLIEEAWSKSTHQPIVALCKETMSVRKAVGIEHIHCNCE